MHFLAMVLAIASIFASLGILAGSNNAPVKSWSATPSTYLAICTAIANLAMRYACIQGVVIAWWHRACRGYVVVVYSSPGVLALFTNLAQDLSR